MRKRAAAFAGICFLLTACSSRTSSQFSYETTSSEVHYEPVDENGMFTDHQIIQDPMRSTYNHGAWNKSGDSQVTSSSTNTPSFSNRVNIVFVGDGYTKSEIAQYKKDYSDNVARIQAGEPFKEYQSYFAFHRVDVVSTESGVSQEVRGKTKNTALEMSYYCGGLARLLCINVNKTLQQAQNAPAVDAVFALANSTVYGGAGYHSPAISTLAARNPAATELALHEFGHSFGLLGDEYEQQGSAQACDSFPNVAAQTVNGMRSSHAKWYRWLDLPNVGAFRGSCYSSNFFRPTENSKMRTLGRPYEAINTEQMVIAIYKKVRPVDSSTPEGTLNGNQVISVKVMKPLAHKLSINWSIDGRRVDKLSDQEKLDTSKLGLRAGSNYKISAVVVDQTALVRDETARGNYLSQTLEWNLNL